MRVIYDAMFARVTRCHEESLSPAPPSVGALVVYLSERHGHRFQEAIYGPGAGQVRPEISILVNGERCELERSLADGDEVALLIPLAGG